MFKLIKKFCIGLFSIYTFNLLFSNINLYIPFNFFTIFISSFLGVFGVVSLAVLLLFV